MMKILNKKTIYSKFSKYERKKMRMETLNKKVVLGILILGLTLLGIYLVFPWQTMLSRGQAVDQSLQKIDLEPTCSKYEFESEFQKNIVETAKKRTRVEVLYDPSYVGIDYPNGDVDNNKGVCTDVVVRALRGGGLDLQKEVHEDMIGNFEQYPSKRIYGLDQTDSNIDHRRVPNLMTYFSRKGFEVDITENSDDYLPGDIVVWTWGGGTKHIGIVIDEKEPGCDRYLVVHNGGWGTVAEDRLFDWDLIGHYRVF